MKRLLIAGLALLTQPAGAEWVYETLPDEMSGVTTHRVITDADREVDRNGYMAHPQLAFECEENPKHFRVTIYADFPIKAYRSSNDLIQAFSGLAWDTRVMLKFDTNKPTNHTFSPGMTTDGRSEVATLGNAWRLTKKFRSADKVLVRVEPLLGGEETFGFDLDGLEFALPHLKEHCELRKL